MHMYLLITNHTTVRTCTCCLVISRCKKLRVIMWIYVYCTSGVSWAELQIAILICCSVLLNEYIRMYIHMYT